MSVPTRINHPEPAELARYVQFTLVDPGATKDQVIQHLEACGNYGFDAAMLPMCWVPLAKTMLMGTGIKIATFFGLGMGHESLHAKLALLRECWALGADEVDYEPNMSFFLSGMYREFKREAELLVEAAEGRAIKVMLELGYIHDTEQRRLAARLLAEAGVPWIKNASGVGPGSEPATPENIRFLRHTVGTSCKVKASGKIKTYEQVLALLDAGAELVGSSAGVEIVTGRAAAEAGY
jgi:deoxyribose-phosphate aldolase